MSSRIGRNIAVIVKSERMIARRHMAVVRRQTIIAGAALILGAVGLVMLNIAAFYSLWSSLGPALAALIVAAVNLVLTGLLLVWAGGLSAEADLAEITQMRDMAIADLQGDAESAVEEVNDIVLGLRRIARDPLGAISMSVIGPLVAIVLQVLRSDKQ
ncbi:phage holin family protein [Tropicimonas sp. IMCC34043]|uniref:phage holin family protein n=1 Tax=Tropicimonas sp. IMCC34043 TaxID=2248760 RepID=UPI000E276AF6|nr:phage holin family protein [Tropicimonas sp. IMCC34043]